MNKREKILIVDDERLNINVLVDLLGTDYDTMVAKNGTQALKRAQSATRPDLILLDIMMPDMDGYEVCRILKGDPRTKDIPVVFITALNQVGDEEKGLELGAIDYISKPISPALVRLRVRNHLNLKRQSEILRDLANLDGMTGIPNRRLFDHQLEHQWRHASSNGIPLSLILMDIDFFKSYNDHFGHVAGDDCLKKVATALARATCRDTDMVARYGGEEFVCLLPGTDAQGAETVGDRLRNAVLELEIPHEYSDVARHLTLSLGGATCVPDLTESSSALVEQADRNLYVAKEQGRNRLQV
ncbi:MAG: diguanylate cyclase [Gammaproteobacteria bacterium]|nr:diguanylate cyclase [Gammaproteobacteria bacterium]